MGFGASRAVFGGAFRSHECDREICGVETRTSITNAVAEIVPIRSRPSGYVASAPRRSDALLSFNLCQAVKLIRLKRLLQRAP